jgi:2-haloalkanoic acid dehalogenase type II
MTGSRRTVVFLDAMGTLVTLEPWATAMMREFTLVSREFDVKFENFSRLWNIEWRAVNQDVRKGGQERFRTIRQLFVEAFASTGRKLGVEFKKDLVSDAVERVCNYVNKNAVPYPDVPKTLETLKSQGHRIGVISDADGDDLIHQLESARILELFDTVTSSSEAMSYKPNPGIFKLALTKMKCTSAQSCHIGDTQEFDVVGANGMGLSSFLVTHGKKEVKSTLPKPTYVVKEVSEVVPILKSSRPKSGM